MQNLVLQFKTKRQCSQLTRGIKLPLNTVQFRLAKNLESMEHVCLG